MGRDGQETWVDVDGRRVRLSHPDKVMLPASGATKLDIAEHYLTCAEGALRGVFGRPTVLKRWPRGAGAEPFFQKRAPKPDPTDSWEREYATIRFPSGRRADLLVPRSIADIIWMVQLNCLDLNPWPVRAEDVDRPDELRVDLDPSPGVEFETVREAALLCRDLLDEMGLTGWPRTSGSRGIHLIVPVEPRWGFDEVRRAALALAREAERRRPDMVTSAWWKEERHGVFIDYNQNARDRTVASAYSVRPTGFVAAPLEWGEVPSAEITAFPLDSFAERYRAVGDLTKGMYDRPGSLEPLLELVDRQERQGLGDAPWPPHYPKGDDEPPRVSPSRKKSNKRG